MIYGGSPRGLDSGNDVYICLDVLLVVDSIGEMFYVVV